jgi:hypothetical protein
MISLGARLQLYAGLTKVFYLLIYTLIYIMYMFIYMCMCADILQAQFNVGSNVNIYVVHESQSETDVEKCPRFALKIR